MKITADSPPVLTALDRPNSYIGRSVPRPNLQRLTQGRGQYVSDVTLPRMAHVAFVRSPHAHARIKSIKAEAAKKAPGVIAVVTGAELAKVMTPWVGVLTHLKGLKSAPQHAIAVERACWQGEAVCAVVARTRAQAEDACELVEVDYEPLPAVTDPETALDAKTPVIHPALGDNLCFERKLEVGKPDKAFAESDAVVETTFMFGRHTGVTTEPRAMVADWNAGEQRLTVYHGTQAPHMMQNLFAKHLDLAEAQVRVLTKDVGGSFGIKVHTYADEMATVALSKLLKRPVKFVADRIESFVTDIHARDHRIKAKIGVKNDGTITAFEIDDLTGIGPYSVYPRTSGIEANQVVNLVGGPYTCGNYRAQARVVFQNKNVMCQYRAVGHPIAVAVTEGLVELAAAKIGMDPLEMRRRNLIADDAYPYTSAVGLKFEKLSHHESLAHLDSMMNYAGLRAEQKKLREQGIYRGIGFARFIEVTNPSAAFYGVGGARITSQDGATVKLDAQGNISVATGVTEQGQGAEAVVAQCVATSFGVPIDKVRVITGDTDNTPYGGGTWASRAAGIGGEAAWQAGKALARQRARRRRRDAAGQARRRSTSATASWSTARPAPSGCRSRNWRASPISAPTRCRPACRPNWSPRAITCRAPGPSPSPTACRRAISRSIPTPASSNCSSTGAWRTAAPSSIRNWSTSRSAAASCRASAPRCSSTASTTSAGRCSTATWPITWCRWRRKCPTSNAATWSRPPPTANSAPRAPAKPAPPARRPCVMNAINDALRPLGAAPLTDMPFTPGKILRALGKV